MYPVCDPDGNVSSVAVYASDITQRKQLEDVLRASERRFRRFLENLADAAYEADAHGNITYTNRMGEVLSGVPLKDLLGNPFLPLFTKQSQEVAIDVYQKTLRGESPEYELTFTNGKICQFKNAPLKDEQDRITGVFGIARDITERKLIERKLKESEEKYRVLVEHSQQGIAIAQGSPPRVVFINPAMAKILGYHVDEITSFSAEKTRAFVHPEDRDIFFGRFKGRLEGKGLSSPIEIRGIRKDGSTVWLDVSSALISYGGVPAIQGTFIDITDRKQAEEALWKAHDELETRVQARTGELERTFQELEIKRSNLEEMNTALRVLLKKRDEDRTEIEKKIITNIRQLIEPYIQKLRGTNLDEKQMAFVSIIQSNLADITSPFLSNLAPPYLNLTPTEIQIADLIKQGRDTKEIAALMHLSWRTIKTHRRNIRSKLNLQNRKTNLRSYLMSFQ
jgi:PAS domain S-box-containing protein